MKRIAKGSMRKKMAKGGPFIGGKGRGSRVTKHGIHPAKSSTRKRG